MGVSPEEGSRAALLLASLSQTPLNLLSPLQHDRALPHKLVGRIISTLAHRRSSINGKSLAIGSCT
jgi:hypothetical protein